MASVGVRLRIADGCPVMYSPAQCDAGLLLRDGKSRMRKPRLRIGGQRCVYCVSAKATTRDHVIPLSRGGNKRITNQVPACARCNGDKSNRGILQYLMWRRLRSELGSARKATRVMRKAEEGN